MAGEAINNALEQAPLPSIIKSLATAVGEAQFALDLNSIEQLKLLADEKHGVQLPGEEEKRTLLQLGMVPSFYHFTETTIEAKVVFSMAESREIDVAAEIHGEVHTPMYTVGASVSAAYSQKYSFEASGSSVISTKLVSVPPPAVLTEVVSRLAQPKSSETKKTT